MRRSFTVEVFKDEKYWIVQVVGNSNIFTQAKKFKDIEFMARDVISLMLDIPENSFDIVIVERARPTYLVYVTKNNAEYLMTIKQEFSDICATADSLEGLEKVARSAIRESLGVPEDSFDLDFITQGRETYFQVG